MMAGVETSAGTDDNPPVRRLADWSPSRLRDLAAAHGTPLYVIDLARVHENAPDADERDEHEMTVAGPVCESADTLARDRELPKPARGDRLAVGTAGAYGYEMANTDNSRPRPAVCAIDGADTELCVRRETIADLARLEE